MSGFKIKLIKIAVSSLYMKSTRKLLWTAYLNTNECDKHRELKYLNVGVLSNTIEIVIKPKTSYILFSLPESLSIDDKIYIICLTDIVEQLIQILAWRYDISLSLNRIVKGNPRGIKVLCSAIKSDKRFTAIFPYNLTERNQQLLEAYSEITNEANRAFKFLMCYRLIEVLSAEFNEKTDNLIKKIFPEIKLVEDKRNPKFKRTIITHIRNKIHATDNRYTFPRSDFNRIIETTKPVLRSLIQRKFANA